ncbi:hypothetical protein JW848_01985, partial [Candidatus Bipolaricaulota bacterium]|nr:hypothetical protein [Candidatus Bipolaricaulota bacterium]
EGFFRSGDGGPAPGEIGWTPADVDEETKGRPMVTDPALPKMHTAEHLLSAVMNARFGCRAPVETHLGDRKSKCDYRVPHPVSDDEMEAVQSEINRIIASDRRVSCYELPREDAKRRFDLTRVPGNLEVIRIVAIEGVDETPCIGQHVEHTSQLGLFSIRSHDMRSTEIVRIRFGLDIVPAASA